MWEHLKWHERASIHPAGKLPPDWEEQCRCTVLCLAKIIKDQDIPIKLVVNFDQTSITYVQGGKNNWAPIGSEQVMVHGSDEKRAFTVVTSVTAHGQLLPFQVIYKGKSVRSFPSKSAEMYKECIELGMHFKFSGDENHWSNHKTMWDFITFLIVPYFEATKKHLGLPPAQKGLVYLDCWSLHCS
ncbi:hypothetical protein M422DRAFT_157705 [Sphaerobolus stellatus SS14]|nr:hypothetical protein M422DRAFT_157705 [Sphaerobolus stellatus SS14]